MLASNGFLPAVQVSGELRYNGHSPDEFDVARTTTYVAQIDNHEPNLTVSETMDFSFLCQVSTHGN